MHGKRGATLKTIGYLAEAGLVIPLGAILSRVPQGLTAPLASLAGRLLFFLDRKDRERARHNLDIIFNKPQLSQAEKDRIVRKLFTNIARLALEYLQLDRIGPQNLPLFLQAENPRAVEDALREEKGVLLVSAHLGNWEYLGLLGSRLGYNIAALLKRQHNPYTDRWLTAIREKTAGVKCLYHGRDLHHRVSLHLKHNGILGILADQREVSRPLMVPFFGKPSATAAGPARLHLWFESPLVMAFCVRRPDGKYRVSFDGPYRFRRRGDLEGDCTRVLTFIHGKYEAMIRKYPEQWLTLLTPRWEIP